MQLLRLWYNCRTVFLRWRISIDQSISLPVTGIVILETIQASKESPFPWLINVIYSGFKSGAWLVGIGIFEPNCTASSSHP